MRGNEGSHVYDVSNTGGGTTSLQAQFMSEGIHHRRDVEEKLKHYGQLREKNN
jgi:hypothetical protein